MRESKTWKHQANSTASTTKQKVKIKKKVKSYQRKLEKEVNEDRNNNGKYDFDYPEGEILEEKRNHPINNRFSKWTIP